MRETVLFLTVLVSAAAPGFAQSPSSAIDRLDANGDGAVSRQEFRIARAADFRRLDADRDGTLTEAEFLGRGADPESPVTRRRRARFAALDADGDGRVTQPEYFEFGARQFRGRDANGDGRISPDELRARHATDGDRAEAPDVFRALDRDGDGFITVAELQAARRLAFRELDRDKNGALDLQEFTLSGRPDAPERFLALDANSDGKVTEAEYLALARPTVQRADRNGDGKVSRAEFGAEN